MYADTRYGACACTGAGEMTIRCGTARAVVLYMKMGMSVDAAVREAAKDMGHLKGGLIDRVTIHAIDAKGNHKVVAVNGNPQNTYWLWRSGDAAPNRCRRRSSRCRRSGEAVAVDGLRRAGPRMEPSHDPARGPQGRLPRRPDDFRRSRRARSAELVALFDFLIDAGSTACASSPTTPSSSRSPMPSAEVRQSHPGTRRRPRAGHRDHHAFQRDVCAARSRRRRTRRRDGHGDAALSRRDHPRRRRRHLRILPRPCPMPSAFRS